MNTTTESGGFARLQPKSVGIRSKTFSDDDRNFLSSDPIGGLRFSTSRPTKLLKTNSTTDSGDFPTPIEIDRDSVRNFFRQQSEPSILGFYWKTSISDRSTNWTLKTNIREWIVKIVSLISNIPHSEKNSILARLTTISIKKFYLDNLKRYAFIVREKKTLKNEPLSQ